MARVTVATTTPDPAYPGEVLHSAQWGVISNTAGISAVDGDNTTTARTGSSTYPWFSFDLGGSFRVTRLQVRATNEGSRIFHNHTGPSSG